MVPLLIVATEDDDDDDDDDAPSSTAAPPPPPPTALPLAEASSVLDGLFLPFLDRSSNLFALMRELEANRRKFN